MKPDEWAEWHYQQPSTTRVVEGCTGQLACQAKALVWLVDFGVQEGYPAAAQDVLGVAGELAVCPDLITIPGLVVADLGVRVSRFGDMWFGRSTDIHRFPPLR
jgi:hypothetical protein